MNRDHKFLSFREYMYSNEIKRLNGVLSFRKKIECFTYNIPMMEFFIHESRLKNFKSFFSNFYHSTEYSLLTINLLQVYKAIKLMKQSWSVLSL